MNLSALADVLSGVPRRVERMVYEAKAAGMRANDPESLARAVLTGTSQASAAPWEGEPQGRNLPYRYGHTPPGSAETEAVLEAAGPWGRMGWVHDAKNERGDLYGFYIKGFMDDWRAGAARQDIAIRNRLAQGLRASDGN